MRRSASRLATAVRLALLVTIGTFAVASFAAQADPRLAQEALRLLDQGDLSGTEAVARKLLRTPSDSAIGNALLGAVRLKQSRYEESARYLETAVRLNPQLIGARLNLANVLVLQAKRDRAELMLRAVLRLDPTNKNALYALARLENEAGRFAESLRLMQGMGEELHGSEDGLVLLTSDELEVKDERAAAECVRDWLALEQVSASGAISMAELLIAHGRLTDAIAVLERAQSRNENSFDIQFLLGEIHFKLGDGKAASAYYQGALQAKGDCEVCLYRLGRIAETEGRLDEALKYLIAGKRVAPANADMLFALGRVCLEKDLYDDAIESLAEAVRLQGRNDSFRYVLASAYTSKKEYAQAIPILQELSAAHPGDPLFSYSLGAVEYLDGQFPVAERNLRASIAGAAPPIGAYYYLGLTLDREGRSAEAERYLRELLDRSADHQPALVALGQVLSEEKRYPEARTVLEKAVQLDGGSVKAHYELGRVLAHLGLAEASAQEFAQVKALNAEEHAHAELKIFDPAGSPKP